MLMAAVTGAMPDSPTTPLITAVAYGKTDVGRQREHNEDQFLSKPDLRLFVIGDALAWNPNLTEDELAGLPKNIISRALGLKKHVEVDIKSETALPGDIFLLCSDGLSGMVKDAQIRDLFQLSDDLTEACDTL